eukprot:m.87988 g.87988  ORF g.87988 m.87988 type:complete len:85 (-) comp12846_c1_seq1:66-320(-)
MITYLLCIIFHNSTCGPMTALSAPCMVNCCSLLSETGTVICNHHATPFLFPIFFPTSFMISKRQVPLAFVDVLQCNCNFERAPN